MVMIKIKSFSRKPYSPKLKIPKNEKIDGNKIRGIYYKVPNCFITFTIHESSCKLTKIVSEKFDINFRFNVNMFSHLHKKIQLAET